VTEPTPRADPRWLLLIAPIAAGLLVAGWDLMYFVCDDAYIAFRYALNRRLGYGWTWNPQPFVPVEGYSSFLWLAIVDAVWTVTGVEPPVSAPRIGLLCGLGTLAVALAMAWSAPLSARLEPARPALVGLAALGLVTNKTFLVWTSSGLEAPLFVLLLVAWTGWATLAPRGRAWVVGGAALAALAALTRPDGLLFLAATPAVWAAAWRDGRPWGRADLAAALPLATVPAHLAWRVATYGEWLPNTYYAKVVEPWLAAGGNHFWYFVLEYGWFFWWPGALLALWRSRATLRVGPTAVAVAALVAHAAYYIWRVGGDHFEFRIYAHVPALLFVVALPMLSALTVRPGRAVGSLALLVALSWPLPWLDVAQLWDITDREEIKRVRRPLADKVPLPLWPWAVLHDDLEERAVAHSVGVAWQTHKQFLLVTASRLPTQEQVLKEFGPGSWDGTLPARRSFPVVVLPAVGLAAWRLPYVAIIDRFGLNDKVIARTPPPPNRHRFQAHDRWPPKGYLACFEPNVSVFDSFEIDDRKAPMTAERIITCEAEHLAAVRAGQVTAEREESP
jgi:arabinofuranosyltransferase